MSQSARARALRWLRHGVASILSEADRPLRFALGALVGLVLVATTILVIGYRRPDGIHMGVLDGIYFSIETIATIGYVDFSFADQVTWLRVLAVGLMMSGVVGAAVFFALLTNLLVGRRLAESFGLHRVVGVRGHVVVIGTGSVGVRVIESLLAQGREVVAVDRDLDSRHLAHVRRLGVEQQPFLVARLRISSGGGLDGLTMSGRSAQTRVLALAQADTPDALEYPPRRDTRFAASDVAFLVGPYEELLAVLRRDQLPAAPTDPALGVDSTARHT